MKKTKFIHALLALTLGTFSSQVMATDTANDSSPDLPDVYKDYNVASGEELASIKERLPGTDLSGKTVYYKGDDVLFLDKNEWKHIDFEVKTTETTIPVPESTTTEDTTTNPIMPSMAIYENANVMYSPSVVDISSKENTVSSMQNIGQSAYAQNTANLTNSMDITGMGGSDLVKNMTVNTNAMNSNAGSSYNNSTNNITTDTNNSSINDYTTTLDSSRAFAQPTS